MGVVMCFCLDGLIFCEKTNRPKAIKIFQNNVLVF